MEVWRGTRARPVQLDAVEEWVAQAAQSYRGRVVLDPWQAVGLAQRLRVRGLRVEEFTFSSASVGRIAATLHRLIRDHMLAIPDDPELFDELANVRLRETSPGVLRLDHDADRHDDRAIALALAATDLLDRGHPAATQSPVAGGERGARDLFYGEGSDLGTGKIDRGVSPTMRF